MGEEEKGTAAAEGQEEPGWDEVLEFAVSGELASQEDAEITVRVWDHHWVSLAVHGHSSLPAVNCFTSLQPNHANLKDLLKP